MTICEDTDLIFDIRLFVSLVNWHFTFLLEHSVQLELSVASHYSAVSTVVQSFTRRICTDLHFALSTGVATWVFSSLTICTFLALYTSRHYLGARSHAWYTSKRSMVAKFLETW